MGIKGKSSNSAKYKSASLKIFAVSAACAVSVLSVSAQYCISAAVSGISVHQPAVHAAEISSGKITLVNSPPGMEWNIYRVADANEDGTLKPDKIFSEYSIPENYSHREEVQTLARTFESYIRTLAVTPVSSGKADENGTLVFTDLKDGWYTAVPEKLTAGKTVYESSSVMMCVSPHSIYGDVWGTEIKAAPKVISSVRQDENIKKIIVKFEQDPSVPPSEDPVVILIYRDDEIFDRVVLEKDNDWTIILPDMPDDNTNWTIIQEDAPENVYPVYHKETDRSDDVPVDRLILVHKNHNNFSIENPFYTMTGQPDDPDNSPDSPDSTVTDTPVTVISTPDETVINEVTVTAADTPEKLPQTGQLWWPIPILLSAGILCTCAGVFVKSKDGDR